MSAPSDVFGGWLLHNAAGGGFLLLLTWGLVRFCRQPALRQRLCEVGLVAALLVSVCSLGPAWLRVPLLKEQQGAPAKPVATIFSTKGLQPLALPSPLPAEETPTLEADTAELALPAPPEAIGWLDWPAPATSEPKAAVDARRTASRLSKSAESVASESIEAAPSPSPERVSRWLLLAYGLTAFCLLARWLLGQLALGSMLREASPAPREIERLFQTMAADFSVVPRLLVSRRLRLPVSCGVWRPTVVVPGSLCDSGDLRRLGWVFAHELTHLERQDAWGCFLFNVGQVLYFYVPWFWSLRRQVRLCQEYIADAAAAAQARDSEDYAQFLLNLTPLLAVPVGATGVLGNSSDLFRRVTMLLQSSMRVERRCPRWWSVTAVAGLLTLGVIISGVTLRADTSLPAEAVSTGDVYKDKDDGPKPKQETPKPKDQETPKPKDPVKRSGSKVGLEFGQEMIQAMQQAGGFQNGQPPQFGQGFMFGGAQHGRLGAGVQTPSETLIEQLELTKGKGLVLTHIQPDSAAAKAGLKKHDVLLELNGAAVSSNPFEFVKALDTIKANTPVDAVVLRKGKKETIKGISLPEAKEVRQFGGFNPGAGIGGGAVGFAGGQFGIGGSMPPMQQGLGGGALGLAGGGALGLNGGLGLGGGNLGGGFGLAGGVPPGLGQFGSVPGGGLTGLGGGQGLVEKGVLTTNFRKDDRFTTRHQEGSLIITVTGTVAEGKVKVSQVQIQDGNHSDKYDSVDSVPEQYQDKVKNLVEVNEKSNISIEIKKPPKTKSPEKKNEAAPDKKPGGN